MKSSERSAMHQEPNVIPMLDILLVLVIIAILMAQQAKVELQLPVAAGEAEPSTPIVLKVLPGPAYMLNGTRIPRDSLIPHLSMVFAPRNEKILFIDGARDVRYQDVYYAYGAVRSAGVTVTAILPAESRRP